MFKGKDLIGQVYNLLIVVSFHGINKHGKRLWLCRCSCKDQNEVIVPTGDLNSNRVKSCGCLKHKRCSNFVDLTDKQFGNIIVMKYAFSDSLWQPHWVVKCLCNNKEFIIKGNLLKTGNTKSCGCLQRETAKRVNTTHGFAKGNHTQRRFYQIWRSMKERCYNKNCEGFQWYGARGIKICDRWLGVDGFIHFRDDMWESYLAHVKEFGEKNTTIGRKNVDGNYELSNVGWETNEEQARSTRCTPITEDYDEHKLWRDRLQKYIRQSIKTYFKSGHTNSLMFIKYVGCSFEEFRKHIEFQWIGNMTWDNYGKGSDKWNLDHIKGCNNFDLSKEEDRKACFNYLNLRPMWELDHKKKSTLRIECLPEATR